MKKRLLVLCLALSVLLTGCDAQKSSTEDPEDDLIVVGLSQVGAESDWRVANSESMKDSFSEGNGYRLIFDDARQKQENQIIAIRKFIQLKVDYIVLLPMVESGWDSVLQEAKEAGIPVILVDRTIETEDPQLYTAHVGSDFRAQGERAAAWMEEVFSHRSSLNIVHVQGTLGSTAQLGRTAALEAAVTRNPEWTILTQFDGDFTQARTYEGLKEYLSLNPGQAIDVVYCENDNEAFGAIQALEEAGYTCGKGGVSIISFDATRNCLQRCMEGKIALAVECNPLLGPLVTQVIQELESGTLSQPERYIQEQVFTKKTLTEELIAQRAY